MKLTHTRYPIILIAIYILFYCGALFLTYSDQRFSDGPVSFGFPFPLYFGGGHCFVPCGPHFLLEYFLLDICIFLVPLGLYFWFRGRKH